METVLLSTTYFGPVQWYQKLIRYRHVLIEQHEAFPKQTYRNRCVIATDQGPLPLTVPVVHDDGMEIRDIRISDHGTWRHRHWQAITSAYGDSPFLEYYEDDLRPFFMEARHEFLLDFNEDIRRTLCSLLDISPDVRLTDSFVPPQPDFQALQTTPAQNADDFRYAIHPKHPAQDSDFIPKPYYQVFRPRLGFIPNMSILDLLLNMGPEAVLYL